MMKGLIQLCYSKFIDASSAQLWERHVFEDTYKEFFMQAQQFDQQGKSDTFQQILASNPKAEAMHYLVSTAAVGYIKQLNNLIPDVANAAGHLCLPFSNFKFEIIHSSKTNKNQHKVAIHFYSETLTWIDIIGDKILFAKGNHIEALRDSAGIDTELLSLSARLNITSFQGVNVFSQQYGG